MINNYLRLHSRLRKVSFGIRLRTKYAESNESSYSLHTSLNLLSILVASRRMAWRLKRTLPRDPKSLPSISTIAFLPMSSVTSTKPVSTVATPIPDYRYNKPWQMTKPRAVGDQRTNKMIWMIRMNSNHLKRKRKMDSKIITQMISIKVKTIGQRSQDTKLRLRLLKSKITH